MPPPTARYSPRWMLADQVALVLRQRYAMEIQAIGVYGSLAHGEDTEGSDVGLVVVTRWTGTGPRPATRQVNGVMVNLRVVSTEQYLVQARTLTTTWPLQADQYLATRALHDPDGWLPRLRDTHLARLARAGADDFAGLARDAWCEARGSYTKAVRLLHRREPDPAMLMLSATRLGVALVEGLLSRTYFRNGIDAVRRAGVADAGPEELAARLAAQAGELAGCGHPVDGDATDLVD